MPTETTKTLTSWPVDRPTKSRLLELQTKYRKRHGQNISQDRIATVALEKVTLADLPSPKDLEGKAAKAA